MPSNLSPPAPAKLQPYPQAPVLFALQGIANNALAFTKPVPRPHEPQHHQTRQRYAIPTQAHGLPTLGTAEQPPAKRITPQAGDGASMGQQDTSRDGPASMGKAKGYSRKAKPPGCRTQPQGRLCQPLADQIGRQQQA